MDFGNIFTLISEKRYTFILLVLITIFLVAILIDIKKKRIDQFMSELSGTRLFTIFAIVTVASVITGLLFLGVYYDFVVQPGASIDQKAMHDFGQGAGSLIQAIWGSAAAIAASLVAIFLAQKAVNLSQTTNDLTEKQTPEYEEAYQKVRLFREAVSPARASKTDESSIQSGFDIIGSELMKDRPEQDIDVHNLIKNAQTSNDVVRFYFFLRLSLKIIQKRSLLANEKRRQKFQTQSNDIFQRLFDEFCEKFYFQASNGRLNSDTALTHPNLIFQRQEIVDYIINNVVDGGAFRSDSFLHFHISFLKEIDNEPVEFRCINSQSDKSLINNLPGISGIFTPFKDSVLSEFSKLKPQKYAISVSEKPFLMDLKNKLCYSLSAKKTHSTLRTYVIHDFESFGMIKSEPFYVKSKFTTFEYFRMVMFLNKLTNIFSHSHFTKIVSGDSLELSQLSALYSHIEKHLDNFFLSIDQWFGNAKDEFELGMRLMPRDHNFKYSMPGEISIEEQKYKESVVKIKSMLGNGEYPEALKNLMIEYSDRVSNYLEEIERQNYSLSNVEKLIHVKDKAAMLFFPRHRMVKTTGFNLALYFDPISSGLKLTGDEGKPVFNITDFESLISDLHDIYNIISAYKSVTSIDSSGRFFDPTGHLIMEHGNLVELISNLYKKYKAIIELFQFISRNPISSLYFPELKVYNDNLKSNEYCHDSVYLICNLLKDVDDFNPIVEYLKDFNNPRIALVA